MPGRCDICQVKLEPGRGTNAGCWDHNHKTGEFRGWLCSNCNKALGLAKDDIRILRLMISYLEERGSEIDDKLVEAVDKAKDALED